MYNQCGKEGVIQKLGLWVPLIYQVSDSVFRNDFQPCGFAWSLWYIKGEIGGGFCGVFQDFLSELHTQIKDLIFQRLFVLVMTILLEITTQEIVFALLSDFLISQGVSFQYQQWGIYGMQIRRWVTLYTSLSMQDFVCNWKYLIWERVFDRWFGCKNDRGVRWEIYIGWVWSG